MQISLQKLNQEKEQRLTLHETIPVDSLQAEIPELIRIEPLDVKAQVVKLDPHLIEVDADQSTRATFNCSRCLGEYEAPVTAHWEEQFTDVEHRAQETEEQEIHFVEGNVVDLTPFIREALILNIPFAPVCREDCKGLCPKCGTNKNQAVCDCVTESIDPRLAKLQELLKQDS